MNRSFNTSVVASALCLSLLAGVRSASAEVIYRTGFEAPTFTAGPIDGQGSWTNGTGAAGVDITTVNPSRGTQALRMDGATLGELAPNYFANYAYPSGGYDTAADSVVYTQVDVRLDGALADEVNNDSALGAYMLISTDLGGGNYVYLAQMGIGSNGKINAYYAAETDGSGASVGKFDGVLNEYNTIGMRVDMAARSIEYYGNGVLLATTPLPDFAVGRRMYMPELDMLAVVDATGYASTFDNLSVSIVPEPACAAAALVGVIAGLRRRPRTAWTAKAATTTWTAATTTTP